MVRGKIIKQKVTAEKVKTAADAGSEVETKDRLGCFGFYSEGDENCKDCSDKQDCIANPAITADDSESDDFESEETVAEEQEDSETEEEEVTEITFDDIAAMESKERILVLSEFEMDDLKAVAEYFEIDIKPDWIKVVVINAIDRALSSKDKDEPVEDDQVDDTEELTVSQFVDKLQAMPTEEIEGYLGEMGTQELKEMAESLELEIPGVRATKPKLIGVMMDYLEGLEVEVEPTEEETKPPESVKEPEPEEEIPVEADKEWKPPELAEVEKDTDKPVEVEEVIEDITNQIEGVVSCESEPVRVDGHKVEMPFGMPTVMDMGSAMFSALRASLILAIPYVSVAQVKELADYLAAKVEELKD